MSSSNNAGVQTSWAASPRLAFAVRCLLFILPIVVGWLAVRTLGQWFWRPAGIAGLLVWFVQATIVGGLVAAVVDRQTRRLLPLATLLGMSLTFPNEAPSRFGMALRTGTVRKLEERIAAVAQNGLDEDETVAATQAIELITMLGKHERLTRGHTERVRAYADLIAAEMGVSDEDRQKLAWAVLLHDIGKLAVPPEILNKDGRPSDAEWEILKRHPAAGEAFVAPLANWLGNWRFATSQHHERWDGTGYPKGIAGERITLAGRITAVADAYDVITSKRSYKNPISHDEARKELVACSGTQFDPAVVRAFLEVSIEDRRSTGYLSGLLELPMFTNVGTGIAATPTVAAVAVLSAAAAPLSVAAEPPLALADAPVATVEFTPPSSTTTTEPASDVSSTVASALAPPLSSTTTVTIATTTTVAPTTAEPTTTAPTTTAPPTTTTPPTTAPPTTTTPTTAPPTTAAPSTTTSTTTAPPPPPAGPEANDDSAEVDEGDDERIRVLRNDEPGSSGSPIDDDTLRIVDQPRMGDVRIHNDHVHYEADEDVEGVDTFTYEICAEDGGCSIATVTVTIDD